MLSSLRYSVPCVNALEQPSKSHLKGLFSRGLKILDSFYQKS